MTSTPLTVLDLIPISSGSSAALTYHARTFGTHAAYSRSQLAK